MDNRSHKMLSNVPLNDYQAIPKMLLQQVIKTQQTVVLDDARETYQAFYDDPYFVQDREQQSVLCQPVLSKGKLTGLLYLETNSPRTFSSESSATHADDGRTGCDFIRKCTFV